MQEDTGMDSEEAPESTPITPSAATSTVAMSEGHSRATTPTASRPSWHVYLVKEPESFAKQWKTDVRSPEEVLGTLAISTFTNSCSNGLDK